VKVHAVGVLKAEYRLALLLEIAGVARSTYFYHQARSGRPDPQAARKAAIARAVADAHGRYGHRRIQAVLVADGHCIAKKTVLRLMRQLDLGCQVRRRRYRSYRGTVGQTAPNRLQRRFTVPAPNQTWVTDVTEFTVGGQKVYVSAILDLFDRQIVAVRIGPAPSLSLTNQTLQDALAAQRPAPGLLVHSDQGFQYQHASWQRLVAAAAAVPSMSRKGNCLDNAVMENFFGHLKAECTRPQCFATPAALIEAVQTSIAWYNTDRISTTLGNQSPVPYRAAYARERHAAQAMDRHAEGSACPW
jgi:putative transposase